MLHRTSNTPLPVFFKPFKICSIYCFVNLWELVNSWFGSWKKPKEFTAVVTKDYLDIFGQ